MSGINTYYDITTTVSSEVGWSTARRNKRTSTVRLDIVSNRPPSSPDSNLSYSFVHKKKKKMLSYAMRWAIALKYVHRSIQDEEKTIILIWLLSHYVIGVSAMKRFRWGSSNEALLSGRLICISFVLVWRKHKNYNHKLAFIKEHCIGNS